MTTRQAGHFFFEPRGYDEVNQVSDAYKEEVKAGYNIRRKIVLMAIWVAIPAALWFAPSLGGLIQPHTDLRGFVHDVGIAWLSLGAAGLVVRVIQLCITRNATEGLAWGFKIITDPFMDIVAVPQGPAQAAARPDDLVGGVARRGRPLRAERNRPAPWTPPPSPSPR